MDVALEPILTSPFRVLKNRKENGDTRTLEFEPANGSNVTLWRPGQFMMMYVFGEGEIPISISGDPGVHGRISHTIRGVGSVSRAVCRARAGSSIGVGLSREVEAVIPALRGQVVLHIKSLT